MSTSSFAAQLTAQIGDEFGAHQQYLAVAAHYESLTLPQLAGFFYRQAREENDFAAEQFMQWFIKEQVEEVATMQDLLAVVRRSEDDLNAIEAYVERDLAAAAPDTTAPKQAGE